ncbi:hypothetical protein [Ruegeria arenilitoris]|uniref:hypothetical protein n=1 Tax=Ruegeria arenilitoris TaxID=1173585 RepID=UPI00147A979D|nr:hypothetical protein [Ruegeria arenilitoris]
MYQGFFRAAKGNWLTLAVPYVALKVFRVMTLKGLFGKSVAQQFRRVLIDVQAWWFGERPYIFCVHPERRAVHELGSAKLVNRLVTKNAVSLESEWHKYQYWTVQVAHSSTFVAKGV